MGIGELPEKDGSSAGQYGCVGKRRPCELWCDVGQVDKLYRGAGRACGRGLEKESLSTSPENSWS